MNSLPIALIVWHRNTGGEAFSALPNAPVIEDVERVRRSTRPRAAAAGVLYRLGDAVAPQRPVRSFRTLG